MRLHLPVLILLSVFLMGQRAHLNPDMAIKSLTCTETATKFSCNAQIQGTRLIASDATPRMELIDTGQVAYLLADTQGGTGDTDLGFYTWEGFSSDQNVWFYDASLQLWQHKRDFHSTNQIETDSDLMADGDVQVATCAQIGSLTAGSASCICRDSGSDRLYHDTDCDATKDTAEVFIDHRTVFLPWTFQHIIGGGIGVADADEYGQTGPPEAWTLTRIDCEAYSGTSVTIKICKGEDLGDDTCSTALHTASTIVCDTTGGDACASGCDTTIANGSMGVRQEYSILVDSVSGTVFTFRLNLEGTID